jgi:hypothetical protein
MKSRHVLTGVAVLGLALFIAWIARNTYWEDVSMPMPPKGEARTNSLYAAERLVAALGATAHPQRNLDTLPDPGSVIYLSYWNWDLIPNRRERLQAWVANGGRLVADRSLIGGDQALERWSGIARQEKKNQTDGAATNEPDAARDSALERLGLCSNLQVAGEERAGYTVCGLDLTSRLTSSRDPSWVLSDQHGIQVLRVAMGRGTVTLLNATPFDNERLFQGEDALLFVSAIGLERGDHIYFLSEEETASLLALMWRHGAPVVMLLLGALALALWRGSPRFGPAAGMPDSARRSLAEQIVGTGRFTLRFGGGRALHAAAVRALREAAERHLSGYRVLGSEERMALLARSTGMDEEALTAAINYTGSRRPGELRRVIALLEMARRRIS